MQDDVVQETSAEVAALVPRYSWELMDEEQRDALMSEIVLPRYGKTTSDGVKMGPTWWGELVGATSNAIQLRIQRLRTGQIKDNDETSNSLSANEKAGLRSTKSILSRKPQAAEQLVESLDDEAKEKLTKALVKDSPSKVVKAVTSTMKTTPSAVEAAPIDTDLFDWPRRVRRTAAAHLEVISEFSDFIDAYGSRVHETSDGEQFTGSDLAIQTLDEVKGEIDLGYSNATGESAVDDAISQILV